MFLYYIILVATPLEGSSLEEKGGGEDPSPNIVVKKKKLRRRNFSRIVFSWEGGGTLLQNIYKPFQDLRKSSLLRESYRSSG